MVALNTGFPSGPIVDPATGELSVIGRAFFIALWNRTGAGIGLSSGEAAASIAAETAARQAADVGLTADVSAEGATRATADSALGARITNEAMIRASADSALQVQMVGANLPAILTEDAITSLKVSAMPGISMVLQGDELLAGVRTGGGVNAKISVSDLYYAVTTFSLATLPLDALPGSGDGGTGFLFIGGAGDGSGSAGGGELSGGDGGDTGDGGNLQFGGGNSGASGGVGGSLLFEVGTGFAGDGNLKLQGLPIADPAVANAVWSENGMLVFSGATLAAALAAADLSGLPSSDPGGGLPWLNGGVLQVGP